MSDNEIKEMFSYLTKDNEIPIQKARQLFTSIYKEAKLSPAITSSLTRSDFEAGYNRIIKSSNVDEQLLYLFYNLDKDKKGYLSPEDVMSMFEAVGRKITINEIENSFKYAKVYKNRMSFEDFKEYFHNF